ncbi:helix-turn-helix transcriptional regulator [Halosegnis marinus]|uniref:Helix-turn-helix transcriptional regulator n=1 Tax=Halosegnis marinus TaxID=3034023 RepID=A0ABD5ZN49_9EURY|nr:hypothetical protein [Halosegnis sp. DT85]
MNDGALDDVAYLARSATRVRLLSRVASGPTTRDRLREDGVARETLRRTLAEFEERGWATAAGGEWAATPLGAYVAASVGECLDDIGAANAVADAVALLPDGARDLGMEAYLDAEVVAATPGDPLKPVRRALAPLSEGGHIRLLAGAVTAETLAATAEGLDAGQRFEAVFDAPAAAALREDPDLAGAARTLLGREGVRAWTTAETLGYSVGLVDGRAAFGLTDERAAPAAYLETGDERVVGWVGERFDALAEAGERLRPADL